MKRLKWFGNAAHFICGDRCQFHLATQVGRYLVSTVGEMWSERSSREINARHADPAWLAEHEQLKGDFFDAAYMKRFGFEEIGYQRKYETMVFKAGKPCTCGCGIPKISGDSLDFAPYNDAKSATAGHMRLVKKWSTK